MGPKEQAKAKDALGSLGDKLLPKKDPDFKVDLASKGASSSPSLPSPSLPSLPSAPSVPKPDLSSKDIIQDQVKDEAKKAVKEIKKVEEREGHRLM